jgi:hypothetical protein
MRLVMARAADGSVLLVSSTVGSRTTTFDPPLVYMPPALRPGEPFEHATQAEVVGESGRRQAGGRAVRRLEYLGDEGGDGVDGAGGLRVVQAELDLDLFPARVVSSTTFWVDGRGIVRERQVNRVWVLGVPSQTRRHDVALGRGAAEPAP